MSTVEICQICLEFCRNVLIKPGSMSDRVQEVLKQAACRAARLAEKEALGMPPLDLAERSECLASADSILELNFQLKLERCFN